MSKRSTANSQQPTTDTTVYLCRNCEQANEAWRAIDNAGEYGHLCAYCASLLDENFLREHYRPISAALAENLS